MDMTPERIEKNASEISKTQPTDNIVKKYLKFLTC